MKIIGKTKDNFLVEATHEELLRAAGCRDMEEFVKQNGGGYSNLSEMLRQGIPSAIVPPEEVASAEL